MDEPEAREVEAQVEMRIRAKRLSDCGLPQGFRLVTPEPRQFWMNSQLIWAFQLEYLGDSQPRRFVMRYHQQVSDETQMRWALEDFTGELVMTGLKLGDLKEFLPLTQTTPLRNVPGVHLRVA